jgi:translation initiation factor IF-2
MSEDKSIRLIKAVKELNIGMNTIVDFLASKGYKVEKQPMAKLDSDMYTTLLKEFAADKIIKEEAKQINIGKIAEMTLRSLTLKNHLKTIVQRNLRTRKF